MMYILDINLHNHTKSDLNLNLYANNFIIRQLQELLCLLDG